MADNTSTTQHITSLDFDITKALQQLEQLKTEFNAATQEIARKNWSINAVINGTDEFDELKEKADEINEHITKIKENIKNVPMTGIQKSTQEIKQLQAELKLLESIYAKDSDSLEALQAKSKKYNEIAAEQKKLVESLSAALKSAEKSYGENSDQAAQFKLQLTNAQTALQNTQNAADAAAKSMQKYANESSSTEQAIAQLQSEMKLLEAVYAKDSNNLEFLEKKSQKYNAIAFEQKKVVAELAEKLKLAESEYGKTSAEATRLRTELTNAQTALQNTKNSAIDAAKAVQEFGKESDDAAENTDELNTNTNTLVSTINSKLVFALKEAGRAAYDAVKSTEDSMTDISRVLGLTASQAEEMRGQMFGLGQDFGRSFNDVSEVTLRFAQAGYNMQDSIELSRSALLALNTAELDVENGTQSLIGIISQWGMEASELTTIIDKLNYTADNNAVTTQDLVDGLLKASSMAKTAGMSFNDTVGVLTAMKVASGAAGKEVGNAFKSIMAYIQRPESLKLFDSMGIDVFKDKATGELLPMMEILENMTQKWNTSQEAMLDTLIESGDALQMMSEEWAIATDSMAEYTDYQNAMAEATDKANTAETRAQAQAAAGVFRRNYYISLMENFNKAVQVSDDLINAEGHSMEENSRYMETLTAKTEQLIVALTELAVTAADAGLLDTAKSAIELATAFTKWNTECNNLVPTLAAVSGLLVAINSQRIANNFAALGGSFRNAANALRGVETAAAGATAAANGLNIALGGIGLAITAISLVVTAVNSIKAAIEEARLETIETGKAAADTATNLETLFADYEELRDTVSRTAEQDEKYKAIQDDIVEILGIRAGALSDLKQGTDEYAKALENAVSTELLLLEADQMAAVEAAKKQYQGISTTISSDTTQIEDNGVPSAGKYLADKGIAESMGNLAVLDMTGDILDDYALLSEAITELELKAAELGNTNFELYEAFTNDNMYHQVKAGYDEIKDGAEEVIETQTKLAQTQYILNNGIPETIEEQRNMEKAIISSVDSTGKLTDEIKAYISTLGTVDKKQVNFFKILNANDYSDVKTTFEEIAKAGELNETTFNSVVHSTVGLHSEISKLGLTSGECVDYLNELYKSTDDASDGMGELGNSTGMSEKELEKLSKAITDAESSITNLNKYIETLNEGNGLTAQQVLELCDTYGLLLEQFTLTEDGYKIETSALEQLRNAQIEAAVASRNSQIEQTKVLQTGVLERIKAYGIEISSIASLAEAENALLELEKKRNETYNGISSRADFEEAEGKYNTDEYNGLVDSIKEIADAYKNTEGLAEDFYKNLGKSFEETKKTSKETVDILKEVTEGFEHLASMGIYTTEEQIAYYEDLRRTLSLTEEQYKSLESTLNKLYQEQLKQQQEAIKEQYEEQKQAIEDKYDDEKEVLEKQLDEEKEAREQYWKDELDNLKANLNAQIKAAKAAYEQKKKLADKSYNNQLEALESLRDNELDNIKAVYDAQISALEKIKAARQAERDEEDYQDERAELLEQISYYEQRTGTEAVEQLERLRKELADLDKQRAREREDEEIDNKISSLKDQRDTELSDAEKYYKSRIEALKAAQETELEIYEDTYKQEIELLENRLDSETKAMQKKRDEDLKQLDEQQKKKLKDLEDAKNTAIKAEEDKWKEIQKIFEDNNLALIASAGEFAPKLYDKFHELFTKKFEMDLEDLKKLMQELESERGNFPNQSGTKPTSKAPESVTDNAPKKPETSSDGFSVGTQVKVSGTAYKDPEGKEPAKSYKNEKTAINRIYSKGSKPYHVGSLGWVDSSQLVKARTGGKTTADGIAMLHKDELIINPPVTKMLEDLLERLSPVPKLDIEAQKDAIFRYWGNEFCKSQKAMYNAVSNNNTYNNRTNNSYSNDNSKQVVNNFNVNAPLQNIEKVEDNADMQSAVNALERDIMRKVSSML